MLRWVLGVVVAATALGWVAPAGAASRSVTIVDNAFNPDNITVLVGDSVTWRNTGQRGHSVKADDGSFDSSPGCSFQNTSSCMAKDGTFTVTFSQPGSYFYYCAVHGSPNGVGMAGVVTVASEGATTTTSTTAATTSTTRRTTSTSGSATTATTRATTTTAKGATTTTVRSSTTTEGSILVPDTIDPNAVTSTTIPLAPVPTLAVREQGDDSNTTALVIGLLVVLAAGLITAAWYLRPRRGL
jgi:plastocyanin